MFVNEESIKAANKVKLTKKQQDGLLKIINKGKKYPVSNKDKKEVMAAKSLLKRKCRILILSVVEKYLESGVSLIDLVRLGEKGLNEAIDKWDFRKKRKYRFSVYATWFIRAEIHKKLGFPVDPEGFGEKRKKRRLK